MKKSVEVYNMNLKEQENYESLNDRIGKLTFFKNNFYIAFLGLL